MGKEAIVGDPARRRKCAGSSRRQKRDDLDLGAPLAHPLGDGFYSQTPFRYGEHIAKFALMPVSPNLADLTGDKVNSSDRPDALRKVIRETIIDGGGAWELRVQLNIDLDAMPIEDASVEWDGEASPYRAVAQITVEPQLSLGAEHAGQVDDETFFSPWHGLTAHRPLGLVNRSRRHAYEMSAELRGKFDG